MEPPCTERYARWCERTDREIIPIFLLNLTPVSCQDLREKVGGNDYLSLLTLLLAESTVDLNLSFIFLFPFIKCRPGDPKFFTFLQNTHFTSQDEFQ